MKIPDGWIPFLVKKPSKDGGFYAVSMLSNGEIFTSLRREEDEVPHMTAYDLNAIAAAMAECEQHEAGLSRAKCGPVNVDADGREVGP